MVKNRAYANALKEIAGLLIITGASPFKVRAFERAARTVERSEDPVHAKVADGTVTDLQNVGKSIAAELSAMAEGHVAPALVSLRSEVPAGLLEVMSVPGIGAKKVKELHERLGITDLATLRVCVLDGSLASAPGFGKKSETRILTELDRIERYRGLLPYPRAIRRAQEALKQLASAGVDAQLSGALARADEYVDEIVLVAMSDVETIIRLVGGDSSNGVVELTDREEIPLRIVGTTAQSYGWVQWLESADTEHRAEIEPRASEVSDQSTTDSVANALGLGFLPAPLRVAGTLQACREPWWQPPLRADELRGDLHMHSTWSDGYSSVKEMAVAAGERGLSHIAITDHSGSLRVANGLNRERVLGQISEVDRLNASGDAPIRVLKGLEVDIMPDGTLDMHDDVLDRLDWVVGSVHQSMRMDSAKMTERLIAAISTGRLHALGHPTGRKIGKRDAYDFDFAAVLDACEEHGVALEINASPNRMDLRADHIREVLDRPSLWITINTDAHSVRELDNAQHGVRMAQRAGVPADRVINCLDLEDFLAETQTVRAP